MRPLKSTSVIVAIAATLVALQRPLSVRSTRPIPALRTDAESRLYDLKNSYDRDTYMNPNPFPLTKRVPRLLRLPVRNSGPIRGGLHVRGAGHLWTLWSKWGDVVSLRLVVNRLEQRGFPCLVGQ